MRRLFLLLFIAAALVHANRTSAQLSGSYTVGAAGNYATIAAAITALQTNGVSGPVTMNIISGSYSGNWTINAIAGTSAVNTVTFQSQAMSVAAVTLSNTAATPMLTFNGCTFLRLRYVTANTSNYGVVLQSGTFTTCDRNIYYCTQANMATGGAAWSSWSVCSGRGLPASCSSIPSSGQRPSCCWHSGSPGW